VIIGAALLTGGLVLGLGCRSETHAGPGADRDVRAARGQFDRFKDIERDAQECAGAGSIGIRWADRGELDRFDERGGAGAGNTGIRWADRGKLGNVVRDLARASTAPRELRCVATKALATPARGARGAASAATGTCAKATRRSQRAQRSDGVQRDDRCPGQPRVRIRTVRACRIGAR
jgi:hypothetical protein